MDPHSMSVQAQAEPLSEPDPDPLPHLGWETYKRRLAEILNSRQIVEETDSRQAKWSIRRSADPRPSRV